MKPRRFNFPEDLNQLNRFCESRAMPCYTRDSLPQAGVIVDDLACGFLYQTDSSVAFIESIVTPKTNDANRVKALDMVCAELVDIAKALGYKNVIAITNSNSMVQRAVNQFNFKDLGTYHVLNLSNDSKAG